MSLALVQHLHLPEHPAADVAQLLLNDLQCREGHGTYRSCPDATCKVSASPPPGHLDLCERCSPRPGTCEKSDCSVCMVRVAQAERGSSQVSTLTQESPLLGSCCPCPSKAGPSSLCSHMTHATRWHSATWILAQPVPHQDLPSLFQTRLGTWHHGPRFGLEQWSQASGSSPTAPGT